MMVEFTHFAFSAGVPAMPNCNTKPPSTRKKAAPSKK